MTETFVEREAKRWTREEIYRLGDTGAFPEKAPYELLDGELVEKMTEKGPHIKATDKVYDALSVVAKPSYYIQGPHPIVLDDQSEPEPDVCVIVGDRDDDADTPTASEVALLVEVCDSSFRDDRRRKVPLTREQTFLRCGSLI